MEPQRHGCACWTYTRGPMRSGFILWVFCICIFLVFSDIQAAISTPSTKTSSEEEQPLTSTADSSITPPQNTNSTPSSSTAPSAAQTPAQPPINNSAPPEASGRVHTSPSSALKDHVAPPREALPVASLSEEVLAVSDERKHKNSGGNATAAAAAAAAAGEESAAAAAKEELRQPLSVAERVRQRFHSQKLFQDEDEEENNNNKNNKNNNNDDNNNNVTDLNPVPLALVDEMLREAQEESVQANSGKKVICLSNCSMHGVCTPYGCSCAPGWGGPDCSSKICQKNCSGNGACVAGACKCVKGFLGEDCSESANDEPESEGCLNDCNGNGICDPVSRQCNCNEGFIGRYCGEEKCPNDCSQPNGRCADSGRCVCNLGFGGADCSVEVCPNSCSGLGVCSSIGCLCYEGSGGADCSEPQKLNHATPFGCASDVDCANRGACEAGRCVCNTGFEGDCRELSRDVFSAVCKHSSSLYVLAFDSNLQPGIKTW